MKEIQPPETSLLDICEKVLSLKASTCEEALILFTETKSILSSNMSNIGSGTREEVERFWFAFILYSVKRLSLTKEADGQAVSGDNGFNLSRILRALKLNIVDFFRELPLFVVKAGPVLLERYGADWENRLQAKELQANFVQLSLLSKYYKRGFQHFFLTYDASAEKTSANSAFYLRDSYHFGWLLFLALRNHACSQFKDLGTCTSGLVSILAILIIHVPCRFRNFSTQDSSRFVMKGDKGVDLVASLLLSARCMTHQTKTMVKESNLIETMDKANGLIETILKKKPSLASEFQIDKLYNINPDGLTYFEDLLDETFISESLINLEKDYDDNRGEVDERVFINGEDSLINLCRVTNGLEEKKKNDDEVNPPVVYGPANRQEPENLCRVTNGLEEKKKNDDEVNPPVVYGPANRHEPENLCRVTNGLEEKKNDPVNRRWVNRPVPLKYGSGYYGLNSDDSDSDSDDSSPYCPPESGFTRRTKKIEKACRDWVSSEADRTADRRIREELDREKPSALSTAPPCYKGEKFAEFDYDGRITRMMKKYGFCPGMGLGKHNQGSTHCIDAVPLPDDRTWEVGSASDYIRQETEKNRRAELERKKNSKAAEK